jgi:hypothetical protein
MEEIIDMVIACETRNISRQAHTGFVNSGVLDMQLDKLKKGVKDVHRARNIELLGWVACEILCHLSDLRLGDWFTPHRTCVMALWPYAQFMRNSWERAFQHYRVGRVRLLGAYLDEPWGGGIDDSRIIRDHEADANAFLLV